MAIETFTPSHIVTGVETNHKKLGRVVAGFIAEARKPSGEIGKFIHRLNLAGDQEDKRFGKFVAKVIARAREKDTRGQHIPIDQMVKRFVIRPRMQNEEPRRTVLPNVFYF